MNGCWRAAWVPANACLRAKLHCCKGVRRTDHKQRAEQSAFRLKSTVRVSLGRRASGKTARASDRACDSSYALQTRSKRVGSPVSTSGRGPLVRRRSSIREDQLCSAGTTSRARWTVGALASAKSREEWANTRCEHSEDSLKRQTCSVTRASRVRRNAVLFSNGPSSSSKRTLHRWRGR